LKPRSVLATVDGGTDDVDGVVEGGTVEVVVVDSDDVVVLSSRADTLGLPPPHALNTSPATRAAVAKEVRGAIGGVRGGSKPPDQTFIC
jgi:hypothetical protein